MRVVLDTNIFLSGLIVKLGPPARILDAWSEGAFTLVSSEWQISEIRGVSRRERMRRRLKPHWVGDLIGRIRKEGELVERPPKVNLSSDPDDNPLLAIALAGKADYLVTGDKNHLLSLKKVEGITIITARAFLDLLRP
jgi:putative PIN family toxin of toxin-antitoxin system